MTDTSASPACWNRLMAEVRSNSAQATLLNSEGENTDARTNNQRLLFPSASIKGRVYDTRQTSTSTRRQGSEPTQHNRRTNRPSAERRDATKPLKLTRSRSTEVLAMLVIMKA